MKIDKRSKNSAYINLDNGLVVYLDTSTGENIINICQGEVGEDPKCELELINGCIQQNSFMSDVNIFSRERNAQQWMLSEMKKKKGRK